MKQLLLAIALTWTALHAEVLEVRIQWTPQLCNDICARNLEKQFHRIYNVDEITMNHPAGQILLKYKPRGVYNFGPINTAMQMIGLTINDIHIKVRGHIKATDREVLLISDGDASVFFLMSPVRPDPGKYVENYNPATHQLTVQHRNQLIDAARSKQYVTISGPLFEPERAPPNYLIVQEIKTEDEKTDH